MTTSSAPLNFYLLERITCIAWVHLIWAPSKAFLNLGGHPLRKSAEFNYTRVLTFRYEETDLFFRGYS